MTNVNTYSSLITSTQQWVNRNDTVFVNNIPLFISLAEQQFFIDCPNLGTEAYATGVFTPNNPTVVKPALWGQTLTISYIDDTGNFVILNRATYELIRSFAPNNNTIPATTFPLNGNPQYYSDYGYNNFIISPTPKEAFTFEVAYYQKAQPLSIENQTNWITEYAYDALFWSVLDKAYKFIENLQTAQLYATEYNSRIQAINNYNLGRKSDRTVDAMRG